MDNKSKLLNLGIDYFILARGAVFFGFSTICGNLYHLAFELLCKAALSINYTSKELKDKFGHKLIKLWVEYKTLYPNEDLSRFDELVSDLERWEAVRYMDFPENVRAMSFSPDFDREIKDRIKKNMVKSFMKGQTHFGFMFDDADELFAKVLSLLPVNPNFVKTYVMKTEAEEIYHRDNKCPYW